jgi:hypothetical protein
MRLSLHHLVLSPISRGYARPKGRLPIRYSPLRQVLTTEVAFL